MKIVLSLSLLIIVGLIPFANAEEVKKKEEITKSQLKDMAEENCTMLSTHARQVMVFRQLIPNSTRYKDKFKEKLVGLDSATAQPFLSNIEMAYKTPFLPKQEDKAKAIDQFGNSIYQKCIASEHKLIDELDIPDAKAEDAKTEEKFTKSQLKEMSEETCRLLGVHAKQAMLFRQFGVNEKEYTDQLKEKLGNSSVNSRLANLVLFNIKLAYEVPVSPAKEDKMKEITKFGDSIYQGCVASGIESIDKLDIPE